MKQFIIGMVALTVILTAASCSSTELLSSWKAENANLNQYNKVLVVALTGSKDRSDQGQCGIRHGGFTQNK